MNRIIFCFFVGEKLGNGVWRWKWGGRKIRFEGIYGVFYLVKVRLEEDCVIIFVGIY